MLLLAVLRLLQLRFREPGIVRSFPDHLDAAGCRTALLLWRGAGPEHALWLIVPMAGLASGLVASLRASDERQRATPLWLMLLAGIASFALLALFSLHLQAFARIADLPAAGIISFGLDGAGAATVGTGLRMAGAGMELAGRAARLWRLVRSCSCWRLRWVAGGRRQ